jgi:hypothetical protein
VPGRDADSLRALDGNPPSRRWRKCSASYRRYRGALRRLPGGHLGLRGDHRRLRTITNAPSISSGGRMVAVNRDDGGHRQKCQHEHHYTEHLIAEMLLHKSGEQ